MTDDDTNQQERPPKEEEYTETDQATIPEWVMPVILETLRLSGKFFWFTSKTIFAWLMRVSSFLGNRERQLRVRRWLLLTGSRWTIIGGLVAFVFGGTIILGVTGRVTLSETDFMTAVFGGIVGGLFSFVPIVITVNQLTISQLVGTPDELRNRIESVHDFRMGIEERIQGEPIMSTEPARFLADVIQPISERAIGLRTAYTDTNTHDAQLDETIHDYVDGIERLTESITEQLDEDDIHLFDVLLLMMGDEYSKNVNTARHIQDKHADMLSERTNEFLTALRELFVSMNIARQYFKSLYLRQELANLSRLIAYTGTGSFLMSLFMLILFATGQPSAESILLELLISAGIALAFSPFAVLFAYVLRLATIAKRTAAPGAFTLDHTTVEFNLRN